MVVIDTKRSLQYLVVCAFITLGCWGAYVFLVQQAGTSGLGPDPVLVLGVLPVIFAAVAGGYLRVGPIRIAATVVTLPLLGAVYWLAVMAVFMRGA